MNTPPESISFSCSIPSISECRFGAEQATLASATGEALANPPLVQNTASVQILFQLAAHSVRCSEAEAGDGVESAVYLFPVPRPLFDPKSQPVPPRVERRFHLSVGFLKIAHLKEAGQFQQRELAPFFRRNMPYPLVDQQLRERPPIYEGQLRFAVG